MKILNRTQFLAMPPGTVYQTFDPDDFSTSGFCIKADTLVESDDWFFYSLDGNAVVDHQDSLDLNRILGGMMEFGRSVHADFDCKERDGAFQDDQMFMVFERNDVVNLILVLTKAVNGWKEPAP